MDCKIPLGRAECSQRISRQVSLACGKAWESHSWNTTGWGKRRRRECCRVECFAARVLRSAQVERLTGHDVRPRVGKEPVRKLKQAVVNVNRRGGSSLDNILSGPTPKKRSCEGIAFRGGDNLSPRSPATHFKNLDQVFPG